MLCCLACGVFAGWLLQAQFNKYPEKYFISAAGFSISSLLHFYAVGSPSSSIFLCCWCQWMIEFPPPNAGHLGILLHHDIGGLANLVTESLLEGTIQTAEEPCWNPSL